MKKLFTILFTAFSLTAAAQMDETPLQKYSVSTNSFWGNWFVEAGITASSFYGDKANAPAANLSSSLLSDFRTNMGLSVALGKWFTPGLGLRTRFDGIWGRTVISDDKATNASRYWTLSEQVLFNFSNLFAGYSETRRWNLVPYLSAGLGRNMSHNTYAIGLGAGIINQWHLSRKTAVFLDLGWHAYEPDFDGAGGNLAGHGLPTKDQKITLSLGFTYHFGRASFQHVPDIETLNVLSQSQIDALNAQLADEQAESERLRSMLANQSSGEGNGQNTPDTPADTTPVVMATPVSIFFNIGSADIASRRELRNVEPLAQMAIQTGATLLVTGYADSATGSAQYNRDLSEQRAKTVARELQQMGVSAAKIQTKAEGGVSQLTPPAHNRRVIVTILLPEREN